MAKKEDGVWRTIGGRRIFIRDGESLVDAMKRSGQFKLRKDARQVRNDKRDYAEDKADFIRREVQDKKEGTAPKLTATAEKYIKQIHEEKESGEFQRKESSGTNRPERPEPKREPKIIKSDEVLDAFKKVESWEDISDVINAIDDQETRTHLRKEAKELREADGSIKGSASYLRSEAMLYGVEDKRSSSDKVYRNAYEEYMKQHPASRLTFNEFKKYME